MFDFLDEDWFIITIEIVFLVLIVFDVKRYIMTKKKEYLTNIVVSIGFFIWASIPFYNSYITWSAKDKQIFISQCLEDDMNASLCDCLDNKIFKEYSYTTYMKIKDSKENDLLEFIEEVKEECLDE